MTELPRYQNFINGQPMANASGETFPVVNPATGEVIYEMEIADEAVQKAAIDSAQTGFKVWSAMTGAQRGRILQRAVALLRERNDELAALEVQDTGKPWQEAQVVDVVTGADTLEYFAGLAPSVEGNQQDLGGDFITPVVSRWACALVSVRGTTRCRLPAGSPPRPWLPATA